MNVPWPWDTSIIDKLDLDSYSKRVLRVWVFFDRLLWTSIGISVSCLALLLFWDLCT